MPSSTAAGTGTQAVDRAAALLVHVLTADGPLTFSDVVSRSGLPKSTVSRLLSSLERSGLVRRDGDGAVTPGVRITDYALRVRPEEDLVALAGPSLARLADATGETVNLAVPSGGEVRQIAQVDSRYVMGAVNWLDRPVPFHCSALGKVFLAYGAPAPAGRLERRTERTITSRAALKAELDLTRQRGFAVADGELETGLMAIAAPVRAADGTVIAAVSVSGPDARITQDAVPRIAVLVKREADALTRTLNSTSRKAGAA